MRFAANLHNESGSDFDMGTKVGLNSAITGLTESQELTLPPPEEGRVLILCAELAIRGASNYLTVKSHDDSSIIIDRGLDVPIAEFGLKSQCCLILHSDGTYWNVLFTGTQSPYFVDS